MVLVMSSRLHRSNEEILPGTPEFDKFSKMLNSVMQELAKKIAEDEEAPMFHVINASNALCCP